MGVNQSIQDPKLRVRNQALPSTVRKWREKSYFERKKCIFFINRKQEFLELSVNLQVNTGTWLAIAFPTETSGSTACTTSSTMPSTSARSGSDLTGPLSYAASALRRPSTSRCLMGYVTSRHVPCVMFLNRLDL